MNLLIFKTTKRVFESIEIISQKASIRISQSDILKSIIVFLIPPPIRHKLLIRILGRQIF